MPGLLRGPKTLPAVPPRDYEIVPVAPARPWHEFTPLSLALLNSCGNLCGLLAAAVHDHLTMRAFAVCQALGVSAFNFLMPKPLKAHQWAAGLWGTAFAVLHTVNLAILLSGYIHTKFSEEEEKVYDEGFKRFGVTPRQFGTMLKTGSKYLDLGPGEVLAMAGTPVDKVVYVVRGTCEARHPQTKGLRMEYDMGIFVGSLEPEAWQEQFIAEVAEATADMPHRQESGGSAAVGKKRTKDIRAMLEDLEDKMGSRTKLQDGENWQNNIVGGPEGARVLYWPLATFATMVGKDDDLAACMERIDEMGLTCQICAGARRMAVDGYNELLESAIYDGRIAPEERTSLERYRARYAIPEEDHNRMLEELGWTVEEFEYGSRRRISRRRLLGTK